MREQRGKKEISGRWNNSDDCQCIYCYYYLIFITIKLQMVFYKMTLHKLKIYKDLNFVWGSKGVDRKLTLLLEWMLMNMCSCMLKSNNNNRIHRLKK